MTWPALPGCERVLVLDRHTNQHELVDLRVVRRIDVSIDCGCWNHARQHFEILITAGGAFVRAARSGDAYFREVDMSGPLTLAIEQAFSGEKRESHEQEQLPGSSQQSTRNRNATER